MPTKQAEAIIHLEAACRLYCTWYETGQPQMTSSSMAYEMVSYCRSALAKLRETNVQWTENADPLADVMSLTDDVNSDVGSD